MSLAVDVGEGLILSETQTIEPGQLQHGQKSGHELTHGHRSGKQGGKGEPGLGLQPVNQPLHAVGHRDLLILDLTDDQLLGQATQHQVEGIPQVDAVTRLQGPFEIGGGKLGNMPRQQAVLVGGEFIELAGGLLEFFVLQQLVHEFPPWIHGIIVVALGRHRGLPPRQQHAAFDFHERGGHDEKLPGHLQVQLLHRAQDGQVLFGDCFQGYIVDVDLVLANQEEQQVERPLENGQFDTVIGVGNHAGMLGPDRAAAMANFPA